MRRRLLFGNFDHIVITRAGVPVVDNISINVGERIDDLGVLGIYASGRNVKINNSDCVWTSEAAGVSVGVNDGVVVGETWGDDPVMVTVTFRTSNGEEYSASIGVIVHNVTYKYFVNANEDYTIDCDVSSAVFGYTLYKTTYDNENFVSANVSSDVISLTFVLSGDKTGSNSMTGNSYTVTGLNNQHSLSNKTYTGTFNLGGAGYVIENTNFGSFDHRNYMVVTQLADEVLKVDGSEEEYATYEYGDLSISVSPTTLSFQNTGGTFSATATTSQDEIRKTYWVSDNSVKSSTTTALVDNATFVWSGDVSPFILSDGDTKTVSVTVGINNTNDTLNKTLTVTATSTKDSDSASAVVTLTQSSKSIVGYEDITVDSSTIVNPVVSAAGGDTSFSANFRQVVRWSDNSTTYQIIPAANVTYTQYHFDNLGITAKSETTVANAISVSVTGLDETPQTANFTYDAKQEANQVVSTAYGTPVISYTGTNPLTIPASGGSAQASESDVTVSQDLLETYTSGQVKTTSTNVTASATISSTVVSAESLGHTIKEQTQVGTSDISVSVNGKDADTLAVPVVQLANVAHDGNNTPSITYGDWEIYFTKDITTSNQDKYLDTVSDGCPYIEESNANIAYNNASESIANIPAAGGTANVHVRAVRTKTTTYYFSSGDICHIVREPEYCPANEVTMTCNNGVTMGAVSHDGTHINTSVFPNPGNNTSTDGKTWTITATIGAQSATTVISQNGGEIVWGTPSISTPTYSTANASADSVSTFNLDYATVSWTWNGVAGSGETVPYSPVYDEFTLNPSDIASVNTSNGNIVWTVNDSYERSVDVTVVLRATVNGSTKIENINTSAVQSSGLVETSRTYDSVSLSVVASPTTIGANGGTFDLIKSGTYVCTIYYSNGSHTTTTFAVNTDDIIVAESGDDYNTFGTPSWSGGNGTVTVASHGTNIRDAKSIVYTATTSNSNLSGLTPTLNVESERTVTQSGNSITETVYGDITISPTTTQSLTVGAAVGNYNQINVVASQEKWDVYSTGETSAHTSVTLDYSTVDESGTELDRFTPSHYEDGENHYLRVTADMANTTTTTKSGYTATMTVKGGGNIEAVVTANVTQSADTRSYKYFIVAGDDKSMACTDTEATFTYTLYKTVYSNSTNAYLSYESSTETVTGTYSGNITGSGSSSNGTLSKSVANNNHNTTAKTYTVTLSIPEGTTQETTNFGDKTAKYTQTITHLADSYSEISNVDYTNFSCWIGDSDDSTANVSSISFSKAGETKTLYGFSRETKTTHYYWASDNVEDTNAKVVNTLNNQATWLWSQIQTEGWTLSNTSSQNASETVTANADNNNRNVVVTLAATSTNGTTKNTAAAISTMVQEAGLNYKYFIVANPDASIACTATTATFGYTIIRNAYNGANVYLNSSIYDGDMSVKVTFSDKISGTTTVLGTNRTVSTSVESNIHKVNPINYYVATFAFTDSSVEDTVNTNVIDTSSGNTYVADWVQRITHNADSEISGGDIIYSDPILNILDTNSGVSTSTITFSRDGETKSITASPQVTKTTYKTWASDGSHSSVESTDTVGTTASEWNWTWSLNTGNPFSIVSGKTTTNPTEVTIGENTTTSERSDTLNVSAIFKADNTITKSSACTVKQEVRNILDGLRIVLGSNASDGIIEYEQAATYTVYAHYSVTGDVDVTSSANLSVYKNSIGTTTSGYVQVTSKGNIRGYNPGSVVPGYTEISVSPNKYTMTTVQDLNLTASKIVYSDRVYGSSNQTVYLCASYKGLTSDRVSLTVNGQPSSVATVVSSGHATNVTWTYNRNKGDTTYVTLRKTNDYTAQFIPEVYGAYTITATEDGISGSATITVTRATNTITASQESLTSFLLSATYNTFNALNYEIFWSDAIAGTSSTSGQFPSGNSSASKTVSSSAGKVITSFSGTVNGTSYQYDDRYNYQFTWSNKEMVSLELIIDDEDIQYNGSTLYSVILKYKDNSSENITGICPIKAYNDEAHTTLSSYVDSASSNVSGFINGTNRGTVVEAYKTISVNPTNSSITTAMTCTINAIGQNYTASRMTTNDKDVYFLATYGTLTAKKSLIVKGDDGVSATKDGDTYEVTTASWANSGGTITSTSGSSTTFSSTTQGTYTVTATAEGYTAEDNTCTINVGSVTVVGLDVYVSNNSLAFGESANLTATIKFSDGNTATFSTNPITYGGTTYSVEYYQLGGTAPAGSFIIDTTTLENQNGGEYVDGTVTATATPSSGYTDETFTLSVSGQSIWTSSSKTIYVGGRVMKQNADDLWSSTGIVENDKNNDNFVTLSGKEGSDVSYEMSGWSVKDGSDPYITYVSGTTGKFGSIAGTGNAVITYTKANNSTGSVEIELESLGDRYTYKYQIVFVNSSNQVITEDEDETTASINANSSIANFYVKVYSYQYENGVHTGLMETITGANARKYIDTATCYRITYGEADYFTTVINDNTISCTIGKNTTTDVRGPFFATVEMSSQYEPEDSSVTVTESYAMYQKVATEGDGLTYKYAAVNLSYSPELQSSDTATEVTFTWSNLRVKYYCGTPRSYDNINPPALSCWTCTVTNGDNTIATKTNCSTSTSVSIPASTSSAQVYTFSMTIVSKATNEDVAAAGYKASIPVYMMALTRPRWTTIDVTIPLTVSNATGYNGYLIFTYKTGDNANILNESVQNATVSFDSSPMSSPNIILTGVPQSHTHFYINGGAVLIKIQGSYTETNFTYTMTAIPASTTLRLTITSALTATLREQ